MPSYRHFNVTLHLVMLTTPSEESELAAYREKRLREIEVYSAKTFFYIKTIIIELDQLTEVALPKSGWIFFLKPGEIPTPDILETAAVGFESYDAIWGGVLIPSEADGGFRNLDGTLFGCTELPTLLFRDPEKWLCSSFFIRAERVTDALHQPIFDVNFYLDLWREGFCIKLGLPFIVQINGQNYTEIKNKIIKYFRQVLIVKRFSFDFENFAFRVAYWNPFAEQILASGRLFEDAQLLALKDVVSPGVTVIDVGANIGQHTIFFAKNLGARKVIPIEPNPNFVSIIKENVLLNELTNVDFSLLGLGVGSKDGKCRIIEGTETPQDTVVEYHPSGEIPVFPLDELVKEDVHFIKIDVDESEIQVLNGMENLLKFMKPIIAIEVVHHNLSEFCDILDKFDYRIDHLFSNPQYSDIVALPRD